MKRRNFLAAGAATGLAAPALANTARKIKLVGTFPRNFPGIGVSAERLAERITALSGGRLEVAFFGGGELVPPFGVNDAVSSGAAELGHTAPYFAVGKIRSAMYFSTFPYGLTAAELAGWLRFGGGQALWDDAYRPHNLKPLPAGSTGTAAGGWFRNEIRGLDDLQGLKMRISGLGGDILRQIGVTTVLTPPQEIYPALAAGTVDAAEFICPWNDLALGLWEVAPYYYLPGFHEPGPGLECIVNLDFWEDLPADLRMVLAEAAAAEGEAVTSAYAYHNARTLADFGRIAPEVRVSAFPADVLDALAGAARAVIAGYPQGDAMSLKIHEAYFAYVRHCAAYGAAMEGRMFADRAAVWGA